MTQGGARRPSNPASYSGIGKRSRRTDGQAIKSPNVQEGTDLTQGDRTIIEQGQRGAPLSKTPTPSFSPTRVPGVGTGAPGELPQHLMALPSTRPGEDEMTPATPVEEPEIDAEVVLKFLEDEFQDDLAAKMLQRIRAERIAPEVPRGTSVPLQTDVPPEPGEPEPIELEPVSGGEPGPMETATPPEQVVEEPVI